jgi:hypothetical protein
MTKNFVSIIVGTVLSYGAFAQTWSGATPGNIYYNSGNVSIGATTPVTNARLHVEGGSVYIKTDWDSPLTFDNSDNSWQYMQFMRSGVRKTWMGLNDLNDFYINKEGGGNLIFYGGNIGIGHTSPQYKLDVAGTARVDLTNSPAFTTKSNLGVVVQQGNIGGDFNSADNYLSIFAHNIEYNGSNWIRRNQYGNTWATVMNSGYFDVQFAQGNGSQSANTVVTPSTLFRISQTGRVGIGTTNINDANYKLFVETGIRTRKVKVDVSTWADYVFSPSYKLPSLKEVEAFIKKNNHLPDVPSEAEVKKEGLDLGQNQAVLLRKIEELTLYIIDQNNRIENLEKRLSGRSKN